MKSVLLNLARVLPLTIALSLALPALASAKAVEAEQLVESTSKTIMLIVEQAPAYIDKDPDRYYRQIQQALDPIVDFDVFSRGVMGHLASNRYVQGLPEADRAAAMQNISDFSAVLHNTVIRGYGKVFYQYAGSQFTMVSSELIGKGDRASVTQKITDTKNQQYTIQYSLNNRDQQGWKIQNIIVEGINMGQSYRAQFESALERYKGSVSDVIKNWPELMQGHE